MVTVVPYYMIMVAQVVCRWGGEGGGSRSG